ncbi:OmpA family protein [Fontimonas sp. SYSU GA230001]|uniref:OmpA family protein n=1 Tax=Fontimonas sp. SYSU GA230001 TaxID=3142450 RepID=UPI0032B32911
MRLKLIAAAAMATMWAGLAQAVTVEDYDIPYVGGAFIYEFNDSARQSDNGLGGEARFGWPLTEFGYANWAAEATLHALKRDRDIDGKADYQRGLMFDLVYDFGLFGWGGEASVGPRFKPFVLAGLGVVQEDVAGSRHEHFGLNLGGGALIPLNWHGLAVRAEARVLGQDNNKSVAGEDLLIDYRLGLGLQLPLTPLFSVADHAPPPAPAARCALAVVDPVTGRSDCGTDSDADGVLDGVDQCPATPIGTAVDARGCAIDLSADADGDGVPDAADRCPGTPPGVTVDATGCPAATGMVLSGVSFGNDDAILTSASRAALEAVAESLKAQPGTRIEIGGHTDNVGNDAYNNVLSQQRAEAVRQFLISRGVDGSRLVAMGYGEFRPIASNDTADGRAQNRRVEFRVIGE